MKKVKRVGLVLGRVDALVCKMCLYKKIIPRILFLFLLLLFSIYISYTNFNLDMEDYNIVLSEDKIEEYYNQNPIKDIGRRLFNLFELNYYDLCIKSYEENRTTIINLSGKELIASKNNYTCTKIKIDEEYNLIPTRFTIPITINFSMLNTWEDIGSGNIKKQEINPYRDFQESYYAQATIKTRDLIFRTIISFMALFSILVIFFYKEIWKFIFPNKKTKTKNL